MFEFVPFLPPRGCASSSSFLPFPLTSSSPSCLHAVISSRQLYKNASFHLNVRFHTQATAAGNTSVCRRNRRRKYLCGLLRKVLRGRSDAARFRPFASPPCVLLDLFVSSLAYDGPRFREPGKFGIFQVAKLFASSFTVSRRTCVIVLSDGIAFAVITVDRRLAAWRSAQALPTPLPLLQNRGLFLSVLRNPADDRYRIFDASCWSV